MVHGNPARSSRDSFTVVPDDPVSHPGTGLRDTAQRKAEGRPAVDLPGRVCYASSSPEDLPPFGADTEFDGLTQIFEPDPCVKGQRYTSFARLRKWPTPPHNNSARRIHSPRFRRSYLCCKAHRNRRETIRNTFRPH